jgi:hypothetical protein
LSVTALAEDAAAQQFAVIGADLKALAHVEVARRYDEWVIEEQEHYARVRRACREFIQPPEPLIKAMEGQPPAPWPDCLERMAIVHLSWEAAGLAFFAYIGHHVHEFIADDSWTRELRELGAQIVREEVAHVTEGGRFVERFLCCENRETRDRVLRAVRFNRALIRRGIQAIFRSDAGLSPFGNVMVGRFDRTYRSVTAGLL